MHKAEVDFLKIIDKSYKKQLKSINVYGIIA